MNTSDERPPYLDGADPVFLGLTRPAMFWGVTHSFFVINLIVCLIGFLAAHSWLAAASGDPYPRPRIPGVSIRRAGVRSGLCQGFEVQSRARTVVFGVRQAMTPLDGTLLRPQPPLARIARREVPESEHIPYACHYDAQTLLTKQGDLLQVIQVAGIPFETADDDLLVLRKNLRNALLRSSADGRFAAYVHTVRRRLCVYPDGEFLPGFAAEIDSRWRAKHSSTRMFANELYVTLLRKAPSVGVRGVKSWIDRLSHRANRTEAPSRSALGPEGAAGDISAVSRVA